MVHAVLFDPFPYRDYDRLVSVGIAALKEVQGRGMLTLLPANAINSEMDFRVNSAVLAASFGIAVLTGLLFGLIPTFHSCRRDLTLALKDAGRGSSGMAGDWTRKGLIVFSVAFSMILLAGAGLMIRTFMILTQDSFGIQKDHVLTMWLPGRTKALRRSRIAIRCTEGCWNVST